MALENTDDDRLALAHRDESGALGVIQGRQWTLHGTNRRKLALRAS